MAAVISVVMLGVQVWRLAVWFETPCQPPGLIRWVLPNFVLMLPYLLVLVRPRSQNLTYISWWAAFSGIVAVAVIFAAAQTSAEHLRTYVDFLGWSTFAVLQWILVANAKRAIAASDDEPAMSAFHVFVFVFMILQLAFLVVAVPAIFRFRTSVRPDAQSVAIGELRRINSDQQAFEATHPGTGYAATLDELRDPLTFRPDAGITEYAYRVSMSPGPRDSSGRIRSYQAWADKLPPQGVCRNFFTNETGTLYFTREHRQATAADIPLQ